MTMIRMPVSLHNANVDLDCDNFDFHEATRIRLFRIILANSIMVKMTMIVVISIVMMLIHSFTRISHVSNHLKCRILRINSDIKSATSSTVALAAI